MYQDHPHWQGHNRNNDDRNNGRNYIRNEERDRERRGVRGERGYEHRPNGRERYEEERSNRRGYYENDRPYQYYGNDNYQHYDEHDYGRESRRMRNAMEQDWRGGNAYPYSRNEFHQQFYRDREHSPRTGYNYGGGREYDFSRARNYSHNNAGWVPERGFRHEYDRRERYRDEYRNDRYNNGRDERDYDYYRNNPQYRQEERRKRY